MRNLAALASGLVVASIATAQTFNCPLVPAAIANQGNVGGGLYFNVHVNTTITIVNLNYVCGTNTAAGNSSLNMFIGPGTWVGQVSANPGPWTLVGSTTPVPVVAGGGATIQAVTGVMNPAGSNPGTVTLSPGDYGVALQAVGHTWSYSNGAFSFNAPGGEFSVATGGASNAFLTLPTFSPRSIQGSIDYSVGGTPMPVALRTTYGPGCYRYFRSFYEFMGNPSTNMDLANTSIRFTLDAANNRYSNIAFQTPAVPVVPPVSTAIAGVVNDGNVVVPLAAGSGPILFPNVGGLGLQVTSVEMCSNGYLNLLGTNPPTANPTVAAFLNGTPRIGIWENYDPATAPAGGGLFYDYDAVNGTHLFTWNQVNLSGASPPSTSTFQLAFFANGDVELRCGVMSMTGGGSFPTMVGFTPGGMSADPGTIDLSVALPISTAGIDQPPLALNANINPTLGSTVNITTSNTTVPGLGICFICFADLGPFSPAGLDLGIIGAPGCVANVDINNGVQFVITNLGIPFPSLTVPLSIPPAPGGLPLIGTQFFSQSVFLDPAQNAFGGLTSNALKIQIGVF